MTKNYTPVKFQIETLENRDAPMTAGSLINGGVGAASYLTGWGDYNRAGGDIRLGQILQVVTDGATGPVS